MALRRILLIEHDEEIREVLRICLRYLAGWDVVSFGSPQESLDAIVSERPDAILLDTFLLKADSLGFVQKILGQTLQSNALTQSVPILLITDKASWFTKEQLCSLGIQGAIAKPFDPVTLPSQIAQILGWHQES
ncbi:response regulator with CheY-like receiver, AAA-type ATPase, and DNA-binding domains [Leptolyngbyaceae cyanobacterium JSC-12]|nr:response regulator with CheY-like receiver, AAA-type ATPase, and DNA-binding domains [Leptolyngbyaceae cyanobacterium JSC-12]